MKLLDVCEFIVDCPHSTAKDEGTGYPLIRTPNIGKGRLLLDSVHRVSEEVYNKRNARAVPKENDLIFAREAPAGNVAIIRKNQKVCLGQRTVLLRPNTESVVPAYLNYFLLAPKQQYGLLGTANGATVAHVNIPTIRNLEINLPDIKTQHRIASILSAYDDLIENNQKQIKLLEEAAQRLYKEWFVDLRFPNYENTPVVDGVPEGWEKKTILDMSAVLRRGISPKYNESGKYTVINQKCIRQTIMDIKESRKQEKEYASDMNLKDSDIVICSTGSGTLGRVGQVFGDYPDTSFDSHVTLIRAKNAINVQFLFWALKNLQPLLMTLGQGSTNQLELPKRVIESYEIICPTDELIKDFQFIVQPIHDKITSLVEIIKNATEARDRLLPKLMSGELEV